MPHFQSLQKRGEFDEIADETADEAVDETATAGLNRLNLRSNGNHSLKIKKMSYSLELLAFGRSQFWLAAFEAFQVPRCRLGIGRKVFTKNHIKI